MARQQTETFQCSASSRLPLLSSSPPWFWTGIGANQSNSQLSAQIAQEPYSLGADNILFMSRIAVGQHTGSSRLHSRAASTPIKSP
jgi:hypothetical protein